MQKFEMPETHAQGRCDVENLEIVQQMDLSDCDVGVQVAWDGRVWLCVNGVAFIRFKPKKSKGSM